MATIEQLEAKVKQLEVRFAQHKHSWVWYWWPKINASDLKGWAGWDWWAGYEYAICPTTATCVASLSSHIIPLDFWSAETNDANMLVTTNKITITKAGTYMVTGSIVYGNIVTGWSWRWISPRKNWSWIAADEINPRSWWTYTNATCLTKCIVWDEIDLVWLVDAPACVDTRTWANQTFLHVARVSD